MKIIITITFLTIFYYSAFAQLDDTLKAKLYLTEAQKLFAKGDFNASLSYVEKTENTLGKKVANTMALKIKIAYNLGNFSQAKELFDDYTKNYMKGAPKELNDEILAMFIDIEEAANVDKRLYIISVGLKLEVHQADLGKMTHQEAKDACSRLGAGWRLPTKEELNQMYLQLHENGKGNFKSDWYWSSTDYEVDMASIMGFDLGLIGANSKKSSYYVRAIREVEAEKHHLLIKVNGKEIEVAKEDLLKMTWQDARDACKKLGAGWRLPTKDELEQMHLQLQKNGKGNFDSGTPYWSSSDYNEERAWFFFFLYGSAAHNPKNATPFNVRAVREIDAFLDMPIIINVNGKKLEIAKEDLGEMKWQDAKDACNKLGAGWRLPTKDELEQIYQQLYKKGMCNFKSANYWSGTENGEIPAWAFTFANGFIFSNYKNFMYYVRAVRSL